jgi:hypothetical protein
VFILQQSTFVNAGGEGWFGVGEWRVTKYTYSTVALKLFSYSTLILIVQRNGGFSLFSARLVIKVKTFLFILVDLPVYEASFHETNSV